MTEALQARKPLGSFPDPEPAHHTRRWTVEALRPWLIGAGPKSRRDGLALRKGTGRHAPRVRLTVRLRPDNWDPRSIQTDPEALKDALLFQAQRNRAAQLADSLRNGSGRTHVRRRIGLVLPAFVPHAPAELVSTPDHPVQAVDARCSPVKGTHEGADPLNDGSPATIVDKHAGKPTSSAMATPATILSEARSMTRIEGVPEWLTARKSDARKGDSPCLGSTRFARSTQAKGLQFTPMEGVLERSMKTPSTARTQNVRRGLDLQSAAPQALVDDAPAAVSLQMPLDPEPKTPGVLEIPATPDEHVDPDHQQDALPAMHYDSDDNVPDYAGGWEDDAGEPDGEADHAEVDLAPSPHQQQEEQQQQEEGPDEEQVEPAKPPQQAIKKRRPSQRHSPGHRLRNELGKRKSLVGAPGVGRVEVAPGVRRSSRQREKPLMWWLNESKEYSRSAHKTMPTVKAIIHHDPNTPWQTVSDPFPGKRRKDNKAATRLDNALEAAAINDDGLPLKKSLLSKKNASGSRKSGSQ